MNITGNQSATKAALTRSPARPNKPQASNPSHASYLRGPFVEHVVTDLIERAYAFKAAFEGYA